MAIVESLVGPLASIIDKVIPDKAARERAKIELIRLEGTQELDTVRARLAAIVAEAQSADPWTSRARPSFLYAMYALLLWAIPMGLIAAVRPDAARAIAEGMSGYLNGLPEPLYALFGTGYLGYTAARQWGKVKGVERQARRYRICLTGGGVRLSAWFVRSYCRGENRTGLAGSAHRWICPHFC